MKGPESGQVPHLLLLALCALPAIDAGLVHWIPAFAGMAAQRDCYALSRAVT
jgi:hypothetical protein